MEPDYLAVILIGGGSSYGRAPDKEKAIAFAVRALRDWNRLFDVSNVDVVVNVIDVQGYSDCQWGGHPDGWMRGKSEATGEYEPIKRIAETVTRRTPRWK
jgi:hypothetical protein